MEMNQSLLARLMDDVGAHFGAYLKRILVASTEYGMFGLPLLDGLHESLPATRCGDCGACCNSVSIFSIEYHRIIRHLLTGHPPDRVRSLLRRVLHLDGRLAEVALPDGGRENRLRCAFRDDDQRTCLIHPVRPFACRLFGLRRFDGSRDCPHVMELAIDPPPLTDERVEKLQAKMMDISESHPLADGKPPVAFFPFEFWAFRFALGVPKALEIYREILVPASTPLSGFYRAQVG